MLSVLVEHFLQIWLAAAAARSGAGRSRIVDFSEGVAAAFDGFFNAILRDAITQTYQFTFIIFVYLIHDCCRGDAEAFRQPLSSNRYTHP